jgi:hypothetical protein
MNKLIDKQEMTNRIKEINSQILMLLDESSVIEKALTLCQKQHQENNLIPNEQLYNDSKWEKKFIESRKRIEIGLNWEKLETKSDRILYILSVFKVEMHPADIVNIVCELDAQANRMNEYDLTNHVLKRYVKKGAVERSVYSPRNITYRFLEYNFSKKKRGPKIKNLIV